MIEQYEHGWHAKGDKLDATAISTDPADCVDKSDIVELDSNAYSCQGTPTSTFTILCGFIQFRENCPQTCSKYTHSSDNPAELCLAVGNIKQRFDIETGVLHLFGIATVNEYSHALASVTFSHTSEDPNDEVRVLEYIIFDGAKYSVPKIRKISISKVNDDPVLMRIENSTLEYREHPEIGIILPVPISDAITVHDVDEITNATLHSAVIKISKNYSPSENQLTFRNTEIITHLWNEATGELKLTGFASQNEYQTALRAVYFHNDMQYSEYREDTEQLQREISIVVNDGNRNTQALTRKIIITTAPSTPSKLSAAASFTWQNPGVRLNWTRPLADNNSPITGYRIFAKRGSSSTLDILVENTNSSHTFYDVSHLSPSSSYIFQVAALNHVGMGNRSNFAGFTTLSEDYVRVGSDGPIRFTGAGNLCAHIADTLGSLVERRFCETDNPQQMFFSRACESGSEYRQLVTSKTLNCLERTSNGQIQAAICSSACAEKQHFQFSSEKWIVEDSPNDCVGLVSNKVEVQSACSGIVHEPGIDYEFCGRNMSASRKCLSIKHVMSLNSSFDKPIKITGWDSGDSPDCQNRPIHILNSNVQLLPRYDDQFVRLACNTGAQSSPLFLVENSKVMLTRFRISGVSSSSCGGVFRLTRQSSAILSSTTARENNALSGAVACLMNASSLLVENGTLLVGNHAAYEGGAVVLHGGSIFNANSGVQLSLNKADNRGGMGTRYFDN
jgi:hypothetical protein